MNDCPRDGAPDVTHTSARDALRETGCRALKVATPDSVSEMLFTVPVRRGRRGAERVHSFKPEADPVQDRRVRGPTPLGNPWRFMDNVSDLLGEMHIAISSTNSSCVAVCCAQSK